jgi:hypothetical protein
MKIRKMNLYHSYLIYQINDSLRNVLMNLLVHKNYVFYICKYLVDDLLPRNNVFNLLGDLIVTNTLSAVYIGGNDDFIILFLSK